MMIHLFFKKCLFHILDVVDERKPAPYSAAGTVEERMQQRAEKKLFLEQMVSRGSTKQAEAMEGVVDKNDLYGMLRFGVDAVFANDSVGPKARRVATLQTLPAQRSFQHQKKVGFV